MDMASVSLSLIRIRLARKQRQDGREINENAYKSKKTLDISCVSDIIGSERADRYRDICRRYRADDDDWVTIKGTHVLLGEGGVAMSGGKLKGMTFSNARSTKSKNSGKSGGSGSNGTGKTGEKAGGKASEPVVKDPVVLKKTAADASKKCDDVIKDIRYSQKLSFKTPDELNEEKANAEAQIKKLERSMKRAENTAKKAEKEAEQLLNGRTHEELKKELEEKTKERKEVFNKVINTFNPEEYTKGAEQYAKLDAEYKKLNEIAQKVDKAGTLRDKADAKAAELAQQKEYLDAIERKQSGAMPDHQALKEAYKTAAAERDKAVLEAFSSASECENSQQATDYLRAKGYFTKKGMWTDDSKVDITKMTPEHAVAYATQVEKFMENYPFLKGRMDGIDCHNFEEDAKVSGKSFSNVLGYAKGTHISFPEGYYGSGKNVSDKYKGDIKKCYENDVKNKFSPQGTDYKAVVDHEFTHAAAKVVGYAAMQKGIMFPGGRVENEVMKRVQMKLYGNYSKAKEGEIRKMVSGYAAHNKGITGSWENTAYGRNTEFLAEAMAEARCSKNPSEVARAAREAFEEIMKEVGLK